MDISRKSVQEFAQWLRENPLPGKHRYGSPKTIESYTSDLERFARWFEQGTGELLSAETLTSDDIQDFISQLQTVKGYKPNTVLRYFAAIRSYCLYLQQTDSRIQRDLTAGIRLPKQTPMTKRGLRRLERRAVERALNLPEKDTEKARLRLIRDRAIVSTLMYVGLRVDRLVNLRLSDIQLGERSGVIHVRHGKGNLDRVAGVPLKARQAIGEWLECREKLPCSHDFVFVQVKKDYRPLGTRSVQQMVQDVGKRAKLAIELSPHILRHTALRLWRKKVGNDRTVAKQMGHSEATMRKYDAVTGSDVAEAAELI